MSTVKIFTDNGMPCKQVDSGAIITIFSVQHLYATPNRILLRYNGGDGDILADDTLQISGATVSGTLEEKAQALRNYFKDFFVEAPGEGGVLEAIDKAYDGKFTVALYGTSIVNDSNSFAKISSEELKNKYGSANSVLIKAYLLGGSYEAAYHGWVKQRYSGLALGRARGDSSSTALSFTYFGEKITIEYSKESNGGSCEILIDGVSHGTVDCNGEQSFRNSYVINTTRANHTITVNPPENGYVYLEHILFEDSKSAGIVFLDYSLGGSSLRNVMDTQVKTGVQVDPIAVVGDNGINAHFDRTDVDLIIVSWVVNDAGLEATNVVNYTSYYKPSIDKILALSRGKYKCIFIVEMAGHYAMINDGGSVWQHAQYSKISDELNELGKYSWVKVVDWDKATMMSSIQNYASAYYTATNINEAAGTFSGDFIHPQSAGHAIAKRLLNNVLGLPNGNYTTPIQALAKRTLSVNPSCPTIDSTLRLINPAGSAFRIISALGGNSSQPYSNIAQHNLAYYYRYAATSLTSAANVQSEINASSDQDAYGKYVVYSSTKNMGLGSLTNNVVRMLTIRGSGNLYVIQAGNGRLGEPDNLIGANALFYIGDTAPVVICIPIHQVGFSGTVGIRGKIYEITITDSTDALLLPL